jgi:hypothetical protein
MRKNLHIVHIIETRILYKFCLYLTRGYRFCSLLCNRLALLSASMEAKRLASSRCLFSSCAFAACISAFVLFPFLFLSLVRALIESFVDFTVSTALLISLLIPEKSVGLDCDVRKTLGPKDVSEFLVVFSATMTIRDLSGSGFAVLKGSDLLGSGAILMY